MSRSVRDPDYRRPGERAGRALYLLEHPGTDPRTWDLLDEPSRAWWVDRATPVATAARSARP